MAVGIPWEIKRHMLPGSGRDAMDRGPILTRSNATPLT